MLVVTGLLVRLSPGRSDLFDYRFALALKMVGLFLDQQGAVFAALGRCAIGCLAQASAS